METKNSFKILVVTDIHDSIENIKILVDKVKDIKFDYIFCCGDAVSVPIAKNDDVEVCKEYIIKLKNIYDELEKLGCPLLWVPGNHEPGIYFHGAEEITKNSENLHKKIKKLGDNLYIAGLGGSVPIMTGKEFKHDVTKHAEIIAVEKASKKINNWRLDGCDIYITLEPCPMCASAIKQARISNIYFGLSNSDSNNFNIVKSILNRDKNNSSCNCYCGYFSDEINMLMKSFFMDVRNGKK